jgi:hypothetical protein
MKLFQNIFKKPTNTTPTLESGAIKELNKLAHKNFSPELINDLNKIFRIYLHEKFKIKEALTIEEVMNELYDKRIKKPQRIKINHLAIEINNIKFKFAEFNKEILEILIAGFEEIITGKQTKGESLSQYIRRMPKMPKKELRKIIKKEKKIDKKETVKFNKIKKQQINQALRREKTLDKQETKKFEKNRKNKIKQAMKQEKVMDKKETGKFKKKQKTQLKIVMKQEKIIDKNQIRKFEKNKKKLLKKALRKEKKLDINISKKFNKNKSKKK